MKLAFSLFLLTPLLALAGDGRASKIPEISSNREVYVKNVEAAMAQWQDVNTSLRRAVGVSPHISRRRERLIETRSFINATLRRIYTDLALLKASSPGEWGNLQRRIQAQFQAMQEKADRIAAE